MRDSDQRAALRAGETDLAPEDLTVLAGIDMDRLEAFSSYTAEKISERFWLERFPGTLRGIAQAYVGPEAPFTTAASLILPSAHFDRAVGEDRTGAALCGWLVENEPPHWLRDLAAFEYLLSCGLPRRAQSQSVDEELETKLVPSLSIFWPPSELPAGHYGLAGPLAAAHFDVPVRSLQEVLGSGVSWPAEEIPEEPESLIVVFEEDGLAELAPSWPEIDLLQFCSEPKSLAQLQSAFPWPELMGAVAGLVEAGLLKQG